jgi:hypothetical protein
MYVCMCSCSCSFESPALALARACWLHHQVCMAGASLASASTPMLQQIAIALRASSRSSHLTCWLAISAGVLMVLNIIVIFVKLIFG